MSNPFRDVQPGEIISATRFNEILRALTQMRQDIDALQVTPGGGSVRITGFSPPTTVGQQVGGELVIQGENFDTPAWNAALLVLTNELTINSARVPPANFVLPRCSSTQLVVIIPSAADDGSLGSSGRQVELHLINRFGTARSQYLVTPSTATRPSPILNPQSAVPPGVQGPGGTNILILGQGVTLNGANFSPTNTENTVSIQVGAPVSTTVAIPSVTANGAGTQITFNMPPTIAGMSSGNSIPSTLRLSVRDAAAPVTANVTVRML